MLRTRSAGLLYDLIAAIHDEQDDHLPTLNELSARRGVSVAALREQLEVAKALGLVEVRPRTGIRRLSYTFSPAVQLSLMAAIQSDPAHFNQFAELRDHVEAAYWRQAVTLLTPQDHQDLQFLVKRAWEKLRGLPVQIPHEEHRQLHLGIFRRLENPFVLGLLEAYWEAYEAVGFSLYADYDYLQRVWHYHEQMVTAICAGDFEAGYRLLVSHQEMRSELPTPAGTQPAGVTAGEETD